MIIEKREKQKQNRNRIKKQNNISNMLQKTSNLSINKSLLNEYTSYKKDGNKKNRLNSYGLKNSIQYQNKKIFKSDDGFFIDTSRSSKKSNGKDTSRTFQQTKKFIKNLSNIYHQNSKSPFRKTHKSLKNNNIVNNTYLKKLPKQMMSTLQDDIIGYTNPSSQLKSPRFLQRSLPCPLVLFQIGESFNPDIMKQIKKYEMEAEYKKQSKNIQYIKQKYIVNSSARKIQRAWKQYKTHKIINQYSNILIRREQKNKKILNLKNSKITQNNTKTLTRQNYYNFLKKTTLQIQQNILVEEELFEEKKQKIQLQEIQKWEELIKQIRKNKLIDQLLLDINNGPKNNQYHQNYKNNHLSCSEKYLLQKSDKFDQYIHQCNQYQSNCQQLFSQQQFQQQLLLKPITLKKQQQHKIKNSLQNYFDNIQLKQLSSILPTQQKYNNFQINSASQQLSKQLIKKYNKNDENTLSIIIPNQQKQSYLQIDERLLTLTRKKKKKYALDKIQHLIKQLQLSIITQFLIQLKNSQNLQTFIKNKKQQGISTDMDSIKDYLQNLITFILEQNPELILSNFNTYYGSNQLLMLRQINQQKSQIFISSYQHQQLLNKQLFYTHWSYAENLICFQKKYQEDIYSEMKRIKKLKKITKIYFEAIFDGFNQCLEPFRRNGFQGEPLVWEVGMSKQPLIQNIEDLKPMIKEGFQNLANLTTIFCGIYAADKQPSLSQQIINQLQEERLRIFLQHQIKASQRYWKSLKREKAWVLCSISSLICEIIFVQFCFELFQLEMGLKL